LSSAAIIHGAIRTLGQTGLNLSAGSLVSRNGGSAPVNCTVMPLIATGTIAKPRILPDAHAFAKLKAQSLLPSAAGILGSLGQGKGKTLQGVVDALGGKKPSSTSSEGQKGSGAFSACLCARDE
jgi:hypothetical protein